MLGCKIELGRRSYGSHLLFYLTVLLLINALIDVGFIYLVITRPGGSGYFCSSYLCENPTGFNNGQTLLKIVDICKDERPKKSCST